MEDDYYGDAIEFGYPEDLRSDNMQLHNREDSRPILDDFYDFEGDLSSPPYSFTTEVMPSDNSYPSGDYRNVQLDINSGAPMAFSNNDRFYDPRNASPISREWKYSRKFSPPDIYRTIFKFGVFNAVQSTCFDEVINHNKNLVISAPTGSGKTALFELGLIRMLEENKKSGNMFKCVYVAPTKALCSERFQDWATKLEPIGLKCCELTGDTVTFGNNAWGDAKNAAVIVTTCEKWDSLTRNWYDHEQILSQVVLFLVDEVHILNESRGSTLEVVISRMKLRGSSVRFILVSATVPNIQDVARWIECGTGQSVPARVFEFGDEYRPCKLTRHVVGVHRRNGTNDFQFANVLDAVLYSNLQQFSVGKPILVFCSTRKGVFVTAERLMKDFSEAEGKKSNTPWSRPSRINHSFCDKRLDDFACAGIGVHHAGIVMEDRKATEQLYLNKVLRVLIATSTLAVGVNLPAQMVVIKGTHVFQNGASKEYSDLDVMQMLGRAGRPQFDKEGTAVIICESDLVQKYKALAQGTTIIESSLHINLVEHLNSEIGLKTITDVETAKTWLRSSFLYQRMQSNPRFYSLGTHSGSDQKTYQENVDDIIMNSISRLKKSQLLEHVENGADSGKLSATPFGEIMSKMYIRRATMDLILAIPKQSNLREIMEGICGAEEFSDLKLRASEKSVFNGLRKDPDIRFEINKVENTTHKVFLLVQAVLGGINLHEYKTPESQPQLEAFSVFKHISRIARAFLDVSMTKKDGAAIKHSLELQVLAENGINSLSTLRKQTPSRIEMLLNRRPPFGMDVLASAADLPQYALKIKEVGVQSDGGKSAVQIDLLIECGLLSDQSVESKRTKKTRSRAYQTTAVLTLTSDLDLVDLRRIPTKALKGTKSFEITADLKKPSQYIIVIITSETIAGVSLQQIYKPTILPSEYPVLDTRPISSVDMDLVGLEDDPDFWNMTLESSSAVGLAPLETTKLKEEMEPEKIITSPRKLKASQQGAAKKHYAGMRSEARYECNHNCKDKTKCRHLCCREGVPESTASKTKTTVIHEPPAKRVSTLQRLHTQSNTSSSSQRNDESILNLLQIHGHTQVAQNLELDEGKRLKMEAPRPPKRKRRTPMEINVPFTQLATNDQDDLGGLNLSDTYSDSDDLPESIIPLLTSSREKQNAANQESTPNKKQPAKEPRNRPKHPSMKKVHSPMKEAKTLFLPDPSDSEGSIEIFTPVKSAERNTSPAPHKKARRVETPKPTRHYGERRLAFSPINTGIEYAQKEQSPEDDGEFKDLDDWLQSGCV
ncbi:hypothetical protein HYPSUDRAFT_75106, partial [Hypholoma sublateritium FD-334 SS-4]